MSTPSTPSQPSASTPSTPATPPAAQPQAGKPVDPKTQVKAVVESIKTGETTTTQAKEAARKLKVKIDGQEREMDEKDVIDGYQLRQVSDKKRSEAEKTMQEYTKLFEHLKKDPIKFMKATGIDFDNLATSYLAKKAEEHMMDPKERELRQAKAEAEQYKKWVEEQKSHQEKTKKEQEISTHRQQIHSEIIQAIEESKELGLPVDEELVIHIAQKMILQDKKQKPLNAKESLTRAYESQQKYLKAMAAKMEGESLIKWLGEDVAMKIRKHDLALLKAKRAAMQPQAQSAVKPQEQKTAKEAPKYKTWSQFKAETLDNIK